MEILNREFELSLGKNLPLSVIVIDNDTPQKLLGRADENLYKAKHQGKNRAVF